MLYLTANTANQTVYLTLDENRANLASYTHYLMVISRDIQGNPETLAQVAEILDETRRITTLRITTVSLTGTGRYYFTVYGQNSASNIDPENASVVGIAEKGIIEMTNSDQYFESPNMTFNEDYIANPLQ